MFHSRGFTARAARLRKDHRDDPAALAGALEELLVSSLRHIPEQMSREIAGHCLATRDDDEARIQALADMVDLLHQQYDEQADPLSTADWALLRDCVDEYAHDLDMNLVQYVMERVVSHKAL